MYKLDDLQHKKVADLKEIATKLKLRKFEKLNKTDLIYKILDEQATVSSKELTKKEEKNSNPKKKREKFVKTPKNNSEEKRIGESSRIIKKYPGRIPVIVEKDPKSKWY